MCKYCDEGESLIENDEINIDIKDNRLSAYVRENDSINIVLISYCPVCGRKLDGYRE